MAHGTRINGTSYGITGGRCLVNGTAYSIKKGRTLLGGTGYDVNIDTKIKITITCANNSPEEDIAGSFEVKIPGLNTIKWGLNDPEDVNLVEEVDKECVIDLYVYAWNGHAFVYLNGEQVGNGYVYEKRYSYIATKSAKITLLVDEGYDAIINILED